MNIKEQLLKEHSRENAESISNYIDNDKIKFSKLMHLFLGKEYKITQRAAFSIGICADNNPNLIKPHIGTLIDNLDNKVHDAVIRNTVRILQDIEIPEEFEGKITKICFDYLLKREIPIAIKAFSMTILYNMTMKYPDLKNELKIIITDLMENGSAGIISRGRKTLKQLDEI